MAKVMIECPSEDLADLDGVPMTVSPVQRLGGTGEVIEIIVALSASVTPLVTAFLSRPSRKPTGKRRVVIDGQRKTLENYDVAEVARILKAIDDVTESD